MKSNQTVTSALKRCKKRGGRVHLRAGTYTVHAPIALNTPSTMLEGDVWAYNLDPNGVFETPYGTKLRLDGRDHPAITVGESALPAGSIICDLGIQGDIVGMDTRGTFDPQKPSASAGLYFGGERVDQGEFRKISCCGLAAGVSIAQNAEIDACRFHKINTDGCCVGLYFAPRASYYAHFDQCVVADTPSYGLFADGTNAKLGRSIHNVDITDLNFVRNCGANHIQGEESAAVYLKHISNCAFRDNIVDYPGVFWYYEPTATSNDERQIQKNQAIGLYVIGNRNRITNNVFSHSSRESVRIEGDGNILLNNIADGDVIIQGVGNTVINLVFSTEKGKLILRGAAADSTSLFGIDESRIVKQAD